MEECSCCLPLSQSKQANALLKGENKKLRNELRETTAKLAEVLGCPSAPALQAIRGTVDLYESRVEYLKQKIDRLLKDNERLQRVAVEQHWEIKSLKKAVEAK